MTPPHIARLAASLDRDVWVSQFADDLRRALAEYGAMLEALREAEETLGFYVVRNNPQWKGEATAGSTIGAVRAAIARVVEG